MTTFVDRAWELFVRRSLHVYWRWSRGMTLGVRAMVFDPTGRIFLIKHSYVPGWHLPGGGVERDETMAETLARELKEEGNIDVLSEPILHAIYFNHRISRRDHIALYVVRDFRQPEPPRPNIEIIAHGFFAPDALPPDTTPGTRARINEVLGGLPPSPRW